MQTDTNPGDYADLSDDALGKWIEHLDTEGEHPEELALMVQERSRRSPVEHEWHASTDDSIDAVIELPGGWRGDKVDESHSMRNDGVKAYIVDQDLIVSTHTQEEGWRHDAISAEAIGACLAAMTEQDAESFMDSLRSVRRAEQAGR